MAKSTGGAFGTLRGQVNGLNFKYSGGQQIVSRYVPNPRNPQTGKQITARGIFSQKSSPFQYVDPMIWRKNLGLKTLSGSAIPEIVSQIGDANNILTGDEVPAKSWLRHMWRVIVDTLRGQDKSSPGTSARFLESCMLFDQIRLSGNDQVNAAVIATAWSILDKNKVRETQFMFSDNTYFNYPDITQPWGAWICSYADDVFNESIDEWETIQQDYLNVGVGLFYLEIILSGKMLNNQNKVVNEISKHQPANSWELTKMYGRGFLCGAVAAAKNLSLSQATSGGIKGALNTFVDDIVNYPISWDWTTSKTDWVVIVDKQGADLVVTVTYNGILKESLNLASYKISVLQANQSDTIYPSFESYEGASNDNECTFTVENYNMDQPVALLCSILGDDDCRSVPVRFFKVLQNDTPHDSLFYFYFNQSMYRNPTFETKYNACGKIYLSDGATAGPVESKTLTCAGTGDFDGATLTTDKAGVFKLKVIQESYFGKFTFDLGGETVTMNVEKLLKPDELYDFGRFNCP